MYPYPPYPIPPTSTQPNFAVSTPSNAPLFAPATLQPGPGATSHALHETLQSTPAAPSVSAALITRPTTRHDLPSATLSLSSSGGLRKEQLTIRALQHANHKLQQLLEQVQTQNDNNVAAAEAELAYFQKHLAAALAAQNALAQRVKELEAALDSASQAAQQTGGATAHGPYLPKNSDYKWIPWMTPLPLQLESNLHIALKRKALAAFQKSLAHNKVRERSEQSKLATAFYRRIALLRGMQALTRNNRQRQLHERLYYQALLATSSADGSGLSHTSSSLHESPSSRLTVAVGQGVARLNAMVRALSREGSTSERPSGASHSTELRIDMAASRLREIMQSATFELDLVNFSRASKIYQRIRVRRLMSSFAQWREHAQRLKRLYVRAGDFEVRSRHRDLQRAWMKWRIAYFSSRADDAISQMERRSNAAQLMDSGLARRNEELLMCNEQLSQQWQAVLGALQTHQKEALSTTQNLLNILEMSLRALSTSNAFAVGLDDQSTEPVEFFSRSALQGAVNALKIPLTQAQLEVAIDNPRNSDQGDLSASKQGDLTMQDLCSADSVKFCEEEVSVKAVQATQSTLIFGTLNHALHEVLRALVSDIVTLRDAFYTSKLELAKAQAIASDYAAEGTHKHTLLSKTLTELQEAQDARQRLTHVCLTIRKSIMTAIESATRTVTDHQGSPTQLTSSVLLVTELLATTLASVVSLLDTHLTQKDVRAERQSDSNSLQSDGSSQPVNPLIDQVGLLRFAIEKLRMQILPPQDRDSHVQTPTFQTTTTNLFDENARSSTSAAASPDKPDVDDTKEPSGVQGTTSSLEEGKILVDGRTPTLTSADPSPMLPETTSTGSFEPVLVQTAAKTASADDSAPEPTIDHVEAQMHDELKQLDNELARLLDGASKTAASSSSDRDCTHTVAALPSFETFINHLSGPSNPAETTTNKMTLTIPEDIESSTSPDAAENTSEHTCVANGGSQPSRSPRVQPQSPSRRSSVTPSRKPVCQRVASLSSPQPQPQPTSSQRTSTITRQDSTNITTPRASKGDKEVGYLQQYQIMQQQQQLQQQQPRLQPMPTTPIRRVSLASPVKQASSTAPRQHRPPSQPGTPNSARASSPPSPTYSTLSQSIQRGGVPDPKQGENASQDGESFDDEEEWLSPVKSRPSAIAIQEPPLERRVTRESASTSANASATPTSSTTPVPASHSTQTHGRTRSLMSPIGIGRAPTPTRASTQGARQPQR